MDQDYSLRRRGRAQRLPPVAARGHQRRQGEAGAGLLAAPVHHQLSRQRARGLLLHPGGWARRLHQRHTRPVAGDRSYRSGCRQPDARGPSGRARGAVDLGRRGEAGRVRHRELQHRPSQCRNRRADPGAADPPRGIRCAGTARALAHRGHSPQPDGRGGRPGGDFRAAAFALHQQCSDRHRRGRQGGRNPHGQRRLHRAFPEGAPRCAARGGHRAG